MKKIASFLPIIFVIFCLILAAACSRDPNVRKQRYLDSGRRYFDKGDFDEASIEFRNAIAIDPDYAPAHYQLALSYLRLQRWSSAGQELSRVIELQPDNYSARIEIARLLIAAGDFQQAQQQADWLLQNRPTDPQSHYVLATLKAAQNHFPDAVAEMQKAIALNPGDSSLYLNLALMQLRDNQSELAEANFLKAIELSPAALAPRLMLANYYQARNRFTDAEQQLRAAIQAEPHNPEPTVALARLYVAEDKKLSAENLLIQTRNNFPNSSVGYRLLGDFYLETEDLEKAVAEYQSLYQDHPKDLQVKKNYTELLIRLNRLQEAEKIDGEILKAHRGDNDGLIYRGELQLHSGNFPAAIDTLQNVIKNNSQNSLAHYQLGIAFEKAGNMQGAENEWRTAVQLRPDMADAQRALAMLAMRKGDMTTLEQSSTRFISLKPNSPEGYALRAVAEINQKHFTSAEADARKALLVSPDKPAGYVGMGNVNFVQGRFKEAADSYRQALERDPKSNDALRGLINAYIASKKPDEAISAANTQIAKSGGTSGFYDLLGTVLFRQKEDLGAAETAFAQAIQLDNKNIDAWTKLGEVQTAAGQSERATSTYQQALKVNPQEAGFYVLLGQLFQSQQHWSEAEDSYEKALDLRQNDASAACNLAFVMIQTGGNLDVALSLAQTARREMPDSSAAADVLGWIYYQKGAFGLAVDSLQQAVKIGLQTKSSDSPRFLYHLGLAYAKNGQNGLAREQLEKTLRMNPNSDIAAAARKQLAQLKS